MKRIKTFLGIALIVIFAIPAISADKVETLTFLWDQEDRELLEKWGLSDDVVACARWHHEPGKCEPQHQQLVDLTHVADVLCINVGWGMGSDGMKYKLDESAAGRLGIRIGLVIELRPLRNSLSMLSKLHSLLYLDVLINLQQLLKMIH